MATVPNHLLRPERRWLTVRTRGEEDVPPNVAPSVSGAIRARFGHYRSSSAPRPVRQLDRTRREMEEHLVEKGLDSPLNALQS